MTRLILTSLSGLSLERSDLADVVVPFSFRFVWGPLPSPDELAAYLAARSDNHAPGTHWSDYIGRWRPATKARKDFGWLEFWGTVRRSRYGLLRARPTNCRWF